MLDEIKRSIGQRQLTVLVAHWWEFFREQQPDEPFIRILHELAEYLGGVNDIQVVAFRQVAQRQFPLN